jgi:AcrR family transcriptional regulator
MQRRAELVEGTRQRIVEATVRLHTTVGPANTSIASIAEEAGVTRLTVYRHFGDLDVLFEACRGHWRAENPPPPPTWAATADLETRARQALTGLYGWYRAHAADLTPIYRDMTAMPASSQQTVAAENRALSDALLEGHVRAGDDGRAMRAVARHLLDFATWRSFAIQQGLDDQEIVEVAVRLLLGMAGDGPGTSGPQAPVRSSGDRPRRPGGPARH